MAGRCVTIPRHIETFGYPYPANTLDFLAIGVGHKIRVTSEAVKDDVELLSTLSQWGYPDVAKATGAFLGYAVNSESVLKAKPQVVFLEVTNKKGIQQVSDLGIPVVGVKFPGQRDGLADLVSYIAWLGDIFGGEARQKAAAYKSFVDETLNNLHLGTAGSTEGVRPTALLVAYWGGNYIGISGRMMSDAVSAAGGVDVMGGQRSRIIDKEQILIWNPDVIVLQTENPTNFDKFRHDDALKVLKAVKNGRVYPFRMSHGGRVENILVASYMATLFYPERFSRAYLVHQIVSFHQTMYGVTLSDDAANKYFAGYRL